MENRETLEDDVRRLIESSTCGITLSNALFSPPTGLFCRLGPTRDDRQAIIKSELYRIAKARINTLLQIEDECLAKARVEITRLAQALPINGLQAADARH